ncbi:MAG: hypothetical protein DME92_10130 [Verrucomicrobia bacterium]|nr:MAG: hypothetical protein DME92_10130 [Verrucomicrobiota bacterium]
MLFGFVVLAQHFAVRVHFDADLLAILLDDGFKVGALLFPADYCPAFGFGLGSVFLPSLVRSCRMPGRRLLLRL